MTLDDIKSTIESNNSFVIFSHIAPDGDAIGSSLVFYNLLKDLGKDVEVVNKDIPTNFKYLSGYDAYIETPTKELYDVAIIVDCPDYKRVREDYWQHIRNAKTTIEFDHHTKNTMFADYCIVDQACPACCQILFSSLNYMGFNITKQMAECMLTGIITDTGGFKNEGVNEETFELAGWCINKGINMTKIYRESMVVITRTKFEEEKLAMDRLEFFENGKIAFTYILKEDDLKLGTVPGDHDGIVEIGRDIKGVEVSIFVHERNEVGTFKLSLRSNDYVDVSEICLLYGGGGHVRAAGATMKMPFEDVKKSIINEVIKSLK